MNRIFLCGFGNVGRAFVKLVLSKKELIAKRNYDLKIVGILDSNGAALDAKGFTEEDLIGLLNTRRGEVSSTEKGRKKISFEEALSITQPNIVVIATPTVYSKDSPGIYLSLTALRNGCNIVTADKSPLALMFKDMMMESSKRNLKFKYKATVMAGTPIIDMLSQIKLYDIEEVEGILNGSTNYILSKVSRDFLSFEEALASAKALGILESDPKLDLEGLDAAAKLVIIANTLGYDLKIEEVKRTSITNQEEKIKSILKKNKVPKYVGILNFSLGKAQIKLSGYPYSDPMSNVNDTLNAIRIKSSINNIFIVGKGAGPLETAHALLSDVVSIIEGC
ncbi:MAG: homoserine dehydrogenase [Candidatus Brockarchaeota archaeon]|nr:homoserine dehydrogenase [Candidatus Brockarchaeota archaeon]MBO3767870.1 homoserine dehydrogenase [Candidatus Brockarchaeota archaeon]